jgi:opacity protein-like surface antigen
MQAVRCLPVILVCFLALAPSATQAQRPRQRAAADDLVDELKPFLGANWNFSVNAGNNNHGRFILQRFAVAGDASAERSLRAENGFSIGVAAGVDLLLRAGVRLGYTYGSSDLVFRTDIGNGSEILDDDDVTELESHTVSIEMMRYVLPSTSTVTPYATAGFVGTWYLIDSASDVVDDEAGTQFRTGALAVLGLKVEFNDHFDIRFEGTSASIRNPFTGSDSYRVPLGVTVDEPTRVSRSNLRFVATYNFGKPQLSSHSSRSTRRTPRR